MKRFEPKKIMVESSTAPANTNLLWVDVNESTGTVERIKEFEGNDWKLKITGNVFYLNYPGTVDNINYSTFGTELFKLFNFDDIERLTKMGDGYSESTVMYYSHALIIKTSDNRELHGCMKAAYYNTQIDGEYYKISMDAPITSGSSLYVAHADGVSQRALNTCRLSALLTVNTNS